MFALGMVSKGNNGKLSGLAGAIYYYRVEGQASDEFVVIVVVSNGDLGFGFGCVVVIDVNLIVIY